MNYTRKILVVDDSPVNRIIMAKILSDNFEIIEAEDGLDAMQILAQEAESISLIILDIVMPIMDGYTFLENYSKIPHAGSIPVIVATQMDSEHDEVRALAAGAADYITKPYKPDVICHRINNIIKLRETAAFINTIERDLLTSLYTKEAFYTRATSLISHEPSNMFDVVCVDIENFRLVNDLFGEAEGDRLLCTMAESLDAIVGSVGGIVGRLGGDVFVAIMPVLDQLQWQEFAEEFHNKLKGHKMPTNIQVKYGIYRTIDRHLSIRAMCDRALQALESIKGKYGIIHAYYDDEMGERRKYELELTNDMKRAISESQFKIYYQPKYDLNTEKIFGAEALVRWDHPEKGLISPAGFIPVFEANGFITQLDFYVWEVVCKNLRKWIDEGKNPPSISVNVSRIDIYNDALPEMLMGLIDKYQLQPKMLHLEITETAYVKNQLQLISMVNRLKKCGFIIEMDDFGSGFSSLTMLSEIPVDVIKLDISLLSNRKKSEKSTSVLRFIINLSRELGIPVIAEGVETRDDLNYLKALKCKYGQGFYYCKPVTEDDFSKILAERYAAEHGSVSEAEESIGCMEQNLEGALGILPCGLARFDLSAGRLISCNEIFARILGYKEPKELCSANPAIESLFDVQFREICSDMMDKLRSGAMSTAEAFGVLPESRNGGRSQCTLLLKSTKIGGRDVVFALLSDFTEEYAESASYNDLKAIISNLPGGLIKFNADDYQIDFVSDSFSELTGYTGEEIILRYAGRFDKMLFGGDREYTLVHMAEQLNMYGEAVCDHRLELLDGKTRWFTTIIRLIRDGAGNRWCYAVVKDKTDQTMGQLNSMNTNIDSLTQLLNKTAFEKLAAERLASECENCALIMLDLDNFFLVNENYGHKHCDELLRVLADFLRSEFRENDIIARFGSDEFAVLITSLTRPEGVFERMNSICKRMIAQIGVSCSMGVALGSQECSAYEVLFSQAVRAMREVKKKSKNGCVIYGEELG